MPHISFLWIALTCITQTAQNPGGPPANKPAANPTAPVAAAQPPVGQPAVPQNEPETAADKVLIESAEKIDKLKYVTADIVQTIRMGEDRIKLKGEFKRGPGYRMKLLLKVQLGDAVGERLQISDGKVGYIYDKVLENENLRQFRVDQVVPLIEKKDLPPSTQRQLLTQLPYLLPGDMLRGYIRSVTFTKVTKGELRDGRKVNAVEGHWRAPVISFLANNQPSATLDTMPPGTPQYLRAYLDEETGWPVAIEMIHRDKTAEYQPVFTFEFTNLKFPATLPDSDFAYTPPKKLTAQDLTVQLTSVLNQVKDRPAKGAAPANSPSSTVSEPITPPKPAAKTN